MSGERERGFARAVPDSEGFNPVTGDPAVLAEAEAEREAEARDRDERPSDSPASEATDVRESEAAPLTDAAAIDHDLLMDDLHEPFEEPGEHRPDHPVPPDAQAARERLREKLYSELDRLAPTLEPEPATPARGPNLFARLRTRAERVARQRIEPRAGRHARRLVFGMALLAGAGLVASRTRGAGPRYGLETSFATVRAIVSEPGDFLDSGPARQIGGEYARGAAAAEIAVVEETFSAVTDPEARLAIVASGVERTLRARDTKALAIWVKRLETIPGIDQDRRGAIIREKAYRRFAEFDRLEGREAEARRWDLWAGEQAELAAKQKTAVEGQGWTPGLAGQVLNGLDLAATRMPAGVSAEYQTGFRAALAEASRSLSLMTDIALTPRKAARSR